MYISDFPWQKHVIPQNVILFISCSSPDSMYFSAFAPSLGFIIYSNLHSSAKVLCVMLTLQSVPRQPPLSDRVRRWAEALVKSCKLESHFGLFPLRHNYKRRKEKEPWVEGPWVMLSTDHLFPQQELLDPLYQRGKIMEPEGGSSALSGGRSETVRRL